MLKPLTLALGVLATSLAAQSPLTTLYSGSALLNGPTVYFNDLVLNVPLTIFQIDVNTSAAINTAGTLDIYWLIGSRVGNETNVGAWTFAGTVPVVAAGTNVPTVGMLPVPLSLPAGNIALAIQTNGINSYYSGSTGLNYSTAEMTLLTGGGSANGALGTAICCQPRTWNGSLHYTVGGGGGQFATRSNYGTGCVGTYASFYQSFPNGTFDLSNSSFQMVPTGSGYIVLPGTNAWFPPTSASLPLTDDSVSTAQNLGFALTYPGGSTSSVYISSNGFVWAQASTVNGCCVGDPVALLSGGARWALNWGDLNPTQGGSVHFDTDPANGAAYVTFVNVPEHNTAANTNTFQLALFSSGIVEYRYQSCMQSNRVVVTGWSPGGGARDPGNIDLSASLPLVTSPDNLPVALAADNRPVAGNTINLITSNLRQSTVFGAVLMSLTPFNPGLPLGAIGMADCFQYQGGEVTFLFVPGGQTSSSLPFAVPNFPGIHVYAQSVVFDPASGLTSLGMLSSNGVDLGIGTQ